MTIQNALEFIRRGQQDKALRRRLVKTDGKDALEAALAEEGLGFTQAEFEEAYSLSLFKCQEYGEAEALMAFRMWWNLLVRSGDQKLGRNISETKEKTNERADSGGCS